MLETVANSVGIFFVAFFGGIAASASKHFFSFLSERAKQKVETRDLFIGMITENLTELRSLSVEYWSSSEGEVPSHLSSRIVALCENIPELYSQLFEDSISVKRQLDVQMNRLSRIITGGTFQQADRTADDAVISQMEPQLMALEVAIRLERTRLRYPWY